MLTIKNGAAAKLGGASAVAALSWCAMAIGLCLLPLLTGCNPSASSTLRQGQRLMEQGKYQEAVVKLRMATTLLGGTNAAAFNELGLACHHAGEPGEAEKAYRRALSLNRDLSEARFNLGCLLLEQDKLEAAKNEFTAYTLHRSNVPDGFLKLGSVQLRLREVLAAEKSYSDALRLSPQSAEALNGLGMARLARGRPTEAAQFFDNALKQQPHYGPALLNLAVVAQQYLKDRSLALEMYKEYLALKPPPPNADALAATVHQLEQELAPPGRRAPTNAVAAPKPGAVQPKPAPLAATPTNAPAKAVPTPVAPKPVVAPAPKPAATEAAKAVAVAPPRPAATNASAPKPAPVPAAPPTTNAQVAKAPPEASVKQGQPVAATRLVPLPPPEQPLVVTSSTPATAEEPKAAKRGFFQRINPANLFRGEKAPVRTTPLGPTAASTSSTPAKVVSPAPEPGSAYTYSSPTQPSAGNRAEAQKAFAQGLKAHQARQLQQAIAGYRKAVELDPSLFEGHYNLGLAAAEAGNLPLALAAYENALAVQPASVDARYNFALVLKQANHFADSAKELERLLAAHPREARAHLALANLYAQQLNQPAKARPHYLKVLELNPGNAQASAIQFWLAANPP